MNQSNIQSLIDSIKQELLPHFVIESVHPHNPVEVRSLPQPWEVVGTGNYAAVVCHPDYPEIVVKKYAPGRPGFEEELEVYQLLGSHPAYSECYYAEDGLLVLKRLHGVTLYDCLHRGLRIHPHIIKDIDTALDYARSRGLYPHDIHAKNVMMFENVGLVVDISDFMQREKCSKWDDFKRAYYWIYLPIFYRLRLKVPYSLLNRLRRSYRFITSLPANFLSFIQKLFRPQSLKP